MLGNRNVVRLLVGHESGRKLVGRVSFLLVLMLLGACSLNPKGEVLVQTTDNNRLNQDKILPNDNEPAPSSVQAQGVITGVISYRERIALLPGAFIRVVLVQQGAGSEPDQEIAEQIFHPTGQVPLHYQLIFNPEEIRDDYRYSIKGQIFSEDERLLFASESVELHPLSPDRNVFLNLVQVQPHHQAYMKPMPVAVNRVFQCGDFVFGTRTGIGEIALYLPDGLTVLSQIKAASGVRYQEGDTLFWMKGDQAMFAYQGIFYRQCLRNTEREARDSAEHRPVSFRGVGQEPPWLLEVVWDQSITLITEYGQKRIQLTEPTIRQSKDSVVYRAQNNEERIQVRVTPEPCIDIMSGKAWPEQVSVWWNNRHYTGCGKTFDRSEFTPRPPA